jgi:asparagine synthase (glutamine-hydrolysing)
VAQAWGAPLRRLVGHDLLAALPAAVEEILALFRLPGGRAAPVAEAQWLDAARSYLPGDILTKVDMASMANSLEVRCPYLDHSLAETAQQLPDELRMQNGRGKLLLRAIGRRHLPAHIVERPKVGFTVPLRNWLDGPLRPLVEDYVRSSSTPLGGYLDLDAMGTLLASTADPSRRARLEFSLLSLAIWAEAPAASCRTDQPTGQRSGG